MTGLLLTLFRLGVVSTLCLSKANAVNWLQILAFNYARVLLGDLPFPFLGFFFFAFLRVLNDHSLLGRG